MKTKHSHKQVRHVFTRIKQGHANVADGKILQEYIDALKGTVLECLPVLQAPRDFTDEQVMALLKDCRLLVED